jgi:ATP-dependent exoDNAse (exonuclease V) alpha subunit
MRISPAGDLLQHLKVILIKYFNQYREHTDNISEYESLFTMFSHFRILCALRRGPYGVTEINRLCERILFEEGLIRIGGPWYPGRPVMIIKNDYGPKARVEPRGTVRRKLECKKSIGQRTKIAYKAESSRNSAQHDKALDSGDKVNAAVA